MLRIAHCRRRRRCRNVTRFVSLEGNHDRIASDVWASGSIFGPARHGPRLILIPLIFDRLESDFGDDAASEWGAEAFGYLHGGEIRGDWGG